MHRLLGMGARLQVTWNLLKKVLIKAKRWQMVDKGYVLEELFKDCYRALLSAAQSNNHCLNHLFLVKPNHVHTMSLRPRVIILTYRCLDMIWLKSLLLTVHYLRMCKSTSAHDVVLIICLYIL